MGTDIYIRTQVKDAHGHWDDLDVPEDIQDTLTNRNYEVFAMLAGVRNEYGITPISEPRGLPADLPPLDNSRFLYNTSWVTAQEVLDYPTSEPGWQTLVPMFGEEPWPAYEFLTGFREAVRNVTLLYPGQEVRFVFSFS